MAFVKRISLVTLLLFVAIPAFADTKPNQNLQPKKSAPTPATSKLSDEQIAEMSKRPNPQKLELPLISPSDLSKLELNLKKAGSE